MITGVAQVALLVREYDEAIAFYRDRLGFVVVEDTRLAPGKRWVRLRAAGGLGSDLLLSRADSAEQTAAIGKQAGGRVLLFLHTDDFGGDFRRLAATGVEVAEPPRDEPYGRIAVIRDLYGNRIDLIHPSG